MKKEKAKTKTRMLQVRLDDEHSFALDFVSAQLDGKKYTQIIEGAILEAAKTEALKLGSNWAVLWSEDEGVRRLNLWAQPLYKATTAERGLRNFTEHHGQFFYADAGLTVPHRRFVLHLWKDLEKYYEIWLEGRHNNHWVAAEAMAKALKAAGIKPPPHGDDK